MYPQIIRSWSLFKWSGPISLDRQHSNAKNLTRPPKKQYNSFPRLLILSTKEKESGQHNRYFHSSYPWYERKQLCLCFNTKPDQCLSKNEI